jgi:hypothetical protein
MFTRRATGLTYRLLLSSRFSPACCQLNAAAAYDQQNTKPHAPRDNPELKTQGSYRITQRIGLFDHTAEYKQGELKWVTTDKHENIEPEDNSASAKSSVLTWIQRRYRYES